MSRGFVSFLFFLTLAPLLLLSVTPSAWPTDSTLFHALSLRRFEWETNLDAIIREELFFSTRAGFPSDIIRSRINTRILSYVSAFPATHHDAIHYSSGFSPLTHTHYFSLLSSPLSPLNVFDLDSRSLVILIPVSQTEKYAEYVYTGGLSGSSILHTRMFANDFNSLAALPAGYRICITSFQQNWPCAGA